MKDSQRVNLARELHDGIAQDLVALGYSLDLLLGQPETSSQTRIALRTLRFSVDALISKVRIEIFNLRISNDEDIKSILEERAFSICGELLTHIEISPIVASPLQGRHLLAIVTELLRNCLSHARASEIDLIVTQAENRIYLEVRDNGIGGAVVSSERFGLMGIQEQVDSLKGTFTINSDEEGTRIRAVI